MYELYSWQSVTHDYELETFVLEYVIILCPDAYETFSSASWNTAKHRFCSLVFWLKLSSSPVLFSNLFVRESKHRSDGFVATVLRQLTNVVLIA